MFLNFLKKDPNLLDLLPEATKVFGKFKMMHQDEIHLVNTIHLLTKGMYRKAQLEAIKFDGIQTSLISHSRLNFFFFLSQAKCCQMRPVLCLPKLPLQLYL